MKQLLLITTTLIVLASCTPSKVGQQTRIDIYCDSCHVDIINRVKVGNNWNYEHPFTGVIAGYKSVLVNKFDSPDQCLQVVYENYTSSITDIGYAIEENDTISSNVLNGYCN